MVGKKVLVMWKSAGSAEKYLPLLNAAEQKWGIPTDLLARVAYQESRFRDDIISGATQSAAGALGIMQIVPRWHPDVNPLIPAAAIDYAGRYLRELHDRFGSWKLALAAYNWGPGNLARNLQTPTTWPAETRAYISDITADVPVV